MLRPTIIAGLVLSFLGGVARAQVQIAIPFAGLTALSNDGRYLVAAANGRQKNTTPNLYIHDILAGKDSGGRILNDFPNADEVQVWSLATNGKEVVIGAVIVTSASNTFTQVVLHYALDGSLKLVSEISPYLCVKISVNSSGNVYCYGTYPLGSPQADEFLIHRYSPGGQLNGRFISTSNLSSAKSRGYEDSKVGVNRIQANDSGQIALWIAPEHKLLIVDENTGKVSGTSFDQLANTPEVGATTQYLHVRGVYFTPDNSVAVDILSIGDHAIVRGRWIKLDIATGNVKSSEDIPSPTPELLGYSSGSNLRGYTLAPNRTLSLESLDEGSFAPTDQKHIQLLHSISAK